MIWVLSAGFGDGHNAAAHAVKEALEKRSPGEIVRLEDWNLRTHPILARALMAGYRSIIVHTPAVWRWFYGWLEHDPERTMDSPVFQMVRERMAEALMQDRPRAIVSTYPAYAGLLHSLPRLGMKLPPLLISLP